MLKYIIVLISIFHLISCNTSSVQPEKSIAGTWSVTDFQNEFLVQMSPKDSMVYAESVKRQKLKLVEFAEFIFNEDGSYHLIYSPMDFDKGKWEITEDTLLIYKSETHQVIDTTIIHFKNKDEADIQMIGADQIAQVSIKRK